MERIAIVLGDLKFISLPDDRHDCCWGPLLITVWRRQDGARDEVAATTCGDNELHDGTVDLSLTRIPVID